MPTYVYKFVDTGETIEVQQEFTDDALTEARHPDSGDLLPVKKVFTPVGVTFKGSGFYKTDNRGSSKSKATTGTTSTSGDSTDSGGGSSDSGGGGKDSSTSSTDTKAPSTPTPSSGPSSPD
jgi:predicted nucleic acid-binding Zn ribbon protein